jgi:hypothetical protein
MSKYDQTQTESVWAKPTPNQAELEFHKKIEAATVELVNLINRANSDSIRAWLERNSGPTEPPYFSYHTGLNAIRDLMDSAYMGSTEAVNLLHKLAEEICVFSQQMLARAPETNEPRDTKPELDEDGLHTALLTLSGLPPERLREIVDKLDSRIRDDYPLKTQPGYLEEWLSEFQDPEEFDCWREKPPLNDDAAVNESPSREKRTKLTATHPDEVAPDEAESDALKLGDAKEPSETDRPETSGQLTKDSSRNDLITKYEDILGSLILYSEELETNDIGRMLYRIQKGDASTDDAETLLLSLLEQASKLKTVDGKPLFDTEKSRTLISKCEILLSRLRDLPPNLLTSNARPELARKKEERASITECEILLGRLLASKFSKDGFNAVKSVIKTSEAWPVLARKGNKKVEISALEQKQLSELGSGLQTPKFANCLTAAEGTPRNLAAQLYHKLSEEREAFLRRPWYTRKDLEENLSLISELKDRTDRGDYSCTEEELGTFIQTFGSCGKKNEVRVILLEGLWKAQARLLDELRSETINAWIEASETFVLWQAFAAWVKNNKEGALKPDVAMSEFAGAESTIFRKLKDGFNLLLLRSEEPEA